jgi:competence ComEA-like helix-hairpin-helix protein
MKPFVFAFASLLLLPALHAQGPSTAAMKQKAETICTACHGLEVAEGSSRPKQDWMQVVEDMMRKGAEGSKTDFEMIINYLSITYGPDITVNTAAAKDLAAMLDLTSQQAAAMVAYRTDKGNFKSLADLTKVPGIPAEKFEGVQAKIKY